MGEREREVRGRQKGLRTPAPLRAAHAPRSELLAEARVVELLGRLEPVEVEMVEREALKGIGLEERERRTLDRALPAERA